MSTSTTAISASMVKELREKTGAGMMDAKNALVEAGGDMDKAAELLRQKGVLTAEKKSGRATAEGLVESRISKDGKQGVLLEINCETDFVARGDMFQKMVQEIADFALKAKATDLDGFLAEKMPSKQTVSDFVKDNVAVIKENLGVRRFTRLEVEKSGAVTTYIHTGGKIGVLLSLKTDGDKLTKDAKFVQLAKDLSMHVASSAPEFLTRDDIPAAVIEEEKRIEMGKEDLQSKPEQIREKIVSGRIDKLLAQRVFLEQPFVKDPSITITDLVAQTAKDLGGTIEVTAFVRYLLGEGVEKRQDNFAEEVMSQIKH